MSEESFKIYSGKRCEEYYKKYNLVSAVHKIIDLENIIKEVREYIKSHTNNCMFELRIEEMEELLEILDKENKDIELDILKALNTDLDDDVEMG